MDIRDIGYLERALDLAERGMGCTSPNPIVGAVIVREGLVLGEGWHVGVGLDHAEVAALRDAVGRAGVSAPLGAGAVDSDSAKAVCAGATMYVTLEPCCTQGRTPPCTTALVDSAIARVVVAAIDPTPSVNGRGLSLLRAAGIAVEVAEGALASRARRQNDGLRKWVTKGLPFVTYKYAMSLDGRVATDLGDARWVSSDESRALVHQWRAWSDAIVVGAGTMAADDPTLTARGIDCSRQPLRVVVDSKCALEATSRLVRSASEGPVLVICGERVAAERLAEVEAWGVGTAVVGVDGEGRLIPGQVLEVLAERQVQTVLLEGGPRLAGSWWSAGMVDKVAAFVCPRVISGQRGVAPLRGEGAASMRDALELSEVAVRQVGTDTLITGYTGGPF